MILQPEEKWDDNYAEEVDVTPEMVKLNFKLKYCRLCLQALDTHYAAVNRKPKCDHTFHLNCLKQFVGAVACQCPLCHDFYKAAKHHAKDYMLLHNLSTRSPMLDMSYQSGY